MQEHGQRTTQREPDASCEEDPRLRRGADRPARPERSGPEPDEAGGVSRALLPEYCKFYFSIALETFSANEGPS